MALVLFALYRRFRRLFGRQPVRRVGLIIRTALLFLVAVLLLAGAAMSASILSFLAAFFGLGVGLGLALYSLSRTTYETTAEGRFYTPDPYVGIGVTGLLIGRLVWRLSTSGVMFGPGEYGAESHGSSAITVGVFFVLATYYVVFGGGVLYHSPAVEAAST